MHLASAGLMFPGILLLLLLLINLLLLPSGFIFLKRGLWPPRVGIEPHCRQCGYLLIGIESAACPECGSMTSPANVVYGQRKRQLGVAALGAAIWLFPSVVLIAAGSHGFSNTSWYHFKPTFMVMRDLQGGSALKAMQELNHREAAGNLSSKYEQQVVEIGLAQQAGRSSGSFASWAIDFAEHQCQARKLTGAQRARLFEQCVQLNLAVPSPVQDGKPVSFQINEASRITASFFYVTVKHWASIQVDRHTINASGGGSGFAGLGASSSPAGGVPSPGVGIHRLTIIPHIELHDRTGNGPVIYSEDRLLTAEFTVIECPK